MALLFPADAIAAVELYVRGGEPVVVDRYYGPPADANTQTLYFGGLKRAGNGNLIALYRVRPDEVIPKDADLEEYFTADVAFRISTDGGKTWGPRRHHSYGGVDGMTLPDGTVLIARADRRFKLRLEMAPYALRYTDMILVMFRYIEAGDYIQAREIAKDIVTLMELSRSIPGPDTFDSKSVNAALRVRIEHAKFEAGIQRQLGKSKDS